MIFKRLINHFLLQKIMTSFVTGNDNAVYLTFDDGPEPGITEFVLDELKKYGFKATFFCRGDNAENYPDLLKRIKDEGHSIGNHTYSHVHAFKICAKEYYDDVDKAKILLQTNVFRPPHGSLTLSSYIKIHQHNHIYFWSLNSGDSDLSLFDYHKSINRLKKNTSPGDIILFHFCQKHEKETRKILPEYLQWLFENGYKSDKL